MLKESLWAGLLTGALLGCPGTAQSQQAAAAGPTKSLTFDNNQSLSGWTLEGDVTIDPSQSRQGQGGSLKIGPKGQALNVHDIFTDA